MVQLSLCLTLLRCCFIRIFLDTRRNYCLRACLRVYTCSNKLRHSLPRESTFYCGESIFIFLHLSNYCHTKGHLQSLLISMQTIKTGSRLNAIVIIADSVCVGATTN